MTQVRSLEQKINSRQETLRLSDAEWHVDSARAIMQRAINLARDVADSEATGLLQGESGTAKSLLAKWIHQQSPRHAKPFGVVSCPSLSVELLESELFGHVRGAFTGAVRDQLGRVATCEGGTLLLDEVGDLPLPLQPKLLRSLQDRQYERLGEGITRRADLRVMAATSVNLSLAMKQGRFREELLYRLNVFEISLPPLRERAEDIPGLVICPRFGYQFRGPDQGHGTPCFSRGVTVCANAQREEAARLRATASPPLHAVR